MSQSIDSIFRPEELQKAREQALTEVLDQQKLFARRANDPAARVAHAELERVLLNTREQWEADGMINPNQEAA
jgi:hypothetical protein